MSTADVPTAAQRCQVMGIINVTPDSFSDGGLFLDVDAAVRRGHELMQDGADLLDVGGESTRPGARRVDEAEELARVIPVVEALARHGFPVSVDTMRASVARQAVAAGAVIVNDVSGGLADPEMLPFLAEVDVTCVLMHWRAHSTRMDDFCFYDSVVDDVCAELRGRVDAALHTGVRPERIILDPGLGFAKSSAQSWELLGALETLRGLGFPVLVGASRKRFLADASAYGRRAPDVAADRDEASDAVAAIAAYGGAWGVRVHSASGPAAAARVAARLHGRALGAERVAALAGER
ncbi:dihydropteroate synthase [Nocardioides albus]|uniref:Dihydropteroate synthase n=1 Tax=Nocardioides albus TaxID=1841 RepID=A0A7W5A2E1_9ACTN|nr:dihydropteroate synthase [Nocardioides albus]MBB3088411.1 dihydropteroate synthase [Nocardioides albus]GGU16108.1 dihydropteroate synthase [Nocardioides albus]